MSMELLTQTNPQVLREFSQYLYRRAHGFIQEVQFLSDAVETITDWSGEARDAFFQTWFAWRQTFRDTAFVMTEASAIIERLADALTLAQDLYHKARLAAVDAGFGLDAQGFIQMPANPAEGVGAAQDAIDLRLLSNTVNDALAEAQAADQRAAMELGEAKEGINAAFAAFAEVFNEKIVPLHSELTGGLLVAAAGLEQRANNPGLPAAQRAQAAQAAGRYRALANHPVFRIGTKTFRGVPLLTGVTAPLAYVQNRAAGDDGGEAATKAVVSTGTGLVAGAAAAAVTVAAIATSAVSVPALAVGGVAIAVGAAASWGGSQIGNYVGPIVHDKVVTPFLEQSRETTGELAEHAKNFPDDLREETRELGTQAKNFPNDLRDELMGR